MEITEQVCTFHSKQAAAGKERSYVSCSHTNTTRGCRSHAGVFLKWLYIRDPPETDLLMLFSGSTFRVLFPCTYVCACAHINKAKNKTLLLPGVWLGKTNKEQIWQLECYVGPEASCFSDCHWLGMFPFWIQTSSSSFSFTTAGLGIG